MLHALRSTILLSLVFGAVACDGSKPQPLDPPITFKLANELNASVFTERAACGLDSWLTIRDADGDVLSLATGGCVNECGKEPLLCAPQAEAAACIPPSVNELAAGAELTRSWTGIFGKWNNDENCTEFLSASGELEATACWGDGMSTDGTTVENEKCKSLSFTVKAGEEVRIAVTAAE